MIKTDETFWVKFSPGLQKSMGAAMASQIGACDGRFIADVLGLESVEDCVRIISYANDHNKKDDHDGMSILWRPFAKSRFYMFNKNSHVGLIF